MVTLITHALQIDMHLLGLATIVSTVLVPCAAIVAFPGAEGNLMLLKGS